MYIMNCTRSDIACGIIKLSWFTNILNQTHWTIMKRVLGYLKHTQHYALYYNKYYVVIKIYSDANQITDSNEVKSTSGCVYTQYRSSLLEIVSIDMYHSLHNEFEFITLDKAGEEAE